jgi:hypothetical protein
MPIPSAPIVKPEPHDVATHDSPDPETPTMTPVLINGKMGAMFSKEPVNQRWAEERAQTLTTRLQLALSTSSVLRNIECHSSMCRLETLHDNRTSFNRFMSSAFENFDTKLTTGGSVSMIQGRTDDGKMDVITYIAAEGEPLPGIDQEDPM